MTKTWRFSLILFMLVLTSKLAAQDAHFSQYYSTPAFLNPALVSTEKDMYFGINYRTQWQNLDFPYKTIQLTFMHPVFMAGAEKIQVGGVGLSIFKDDVGNNNGFSTSGALISASYNLRLDRQGKQLIAFGLQGGYTRKSINLGDLQWGSQYNPLIGYDYSITPDTEILNEVIGYATVNTGIVYYYNPNKLYYFNKISGFAGLAVSYLNRPNESLIVGNSDIVPVLYKIHGGIEMKLGRQVYFSPNFLFMHQGNADEINVGAYMTYELVNLRSGSKMKLNSIVFGTWYRLDDSFIFSFGLATNTLSFGFSYDLNVSSLQQTYQGLSAYEMSLSYRVNKGKGIRRFSSPLF